MRLFTQYLLLSCLFCTSLISFAQISQSELEQKVDELCANIDAQSGPGAAIIVVKDGEVMFNKTYGLANLEYEVPLTDQSVFDIASVSKQFTGFAISTLIEEGKLSMDDEIHQYLPDLPDFGHPITIAHLVHHTSGLRDWTTSLQLSGISFRDVISFEQIMEMVRNQRGLNFPPGEQYSYSNTGYNVLVAIIEKVTEESFPDWTQKNIFEPLGMNNSHFQNDLSKVIKNRADSYYRGGDGEYHLVSNNLTALGSSAMHSTTEDMAKWAANLSSAKVGGRSVIDRMFEVGKLNNGEDITYAYGLELGDYYGHDYIDHSGSWLGFQTEIVYFPKEDLSIVVLRNDRRNAVGTAFSIAKTLVVEDSQTKNNQSSDKEEAPNLELKKEELQVFTGTYRLGPAWYVTITLEDDHLMTQATDEDAFPLAARTNNKFWVKAYRSHIEFVKNDQGEVTQFLYRGKECPKVEGQIGVPMEKRQEYLGTYYNEELDATYEVILKEEELALKHRRHGIIGLIPGWEDDFRGKRYFVSSVDFFKDDQGQVAGFKTWQRRSRNNVFLKIKKRGE